MIASEAKGAPCMNAEADQGYRLRVIFSGNSERKELCKNRIFMQYCRYRKLIIFIVNLQKSAENRPVLRGAGRFLANDMVV